MLFRELDAEVYTFRPSTQAKAGRVLDQPCLHSELQAARVTYTAPPPKRCYLALWRHCSYTTPTFLRFLV
ncbi:rCG42338 [Rattus norvegicus]|uniref:RCG42338 n=1 Tax=Rattus norvegicus TaxID=10116 RepID=A6KG42_RAT|nr:rCG42338 [Rattus norvegicus]